MDNIKTKKKAVAAISAFIFLFTMYSAFVFRTLDPLKAFDIWKCIVIENNDIYRIKKGYYSGGATDHSNEGYVFSSYDNTPVEVMDKIGFHDIGHVYFGGKKEQPEYCTSECGMHAIIEGRIFYFGGYVLKYKVVGEA